MSVLNMAIDFGGSWHITQFICLALASCLLIHRTKLKLSAKVLWAYVVIQALYLIEYPNSPFGAVNTAYQATAGQTLAEVILIPLLALYAPKRIWKLVPYFCFFEIVLTWLWRGGTVSFNTALIALCLPFVGSWMTVLGVATIVAHHGSTALVILAVQVIYYCYKRGFIRWLIVTSPLIAYAVYLRGFWMGAPDRLQAYSRYMRAWWNSGIDNVYFGVGAGSFAWSAIAIDHFTGELYIFMHNDLLQILFEYGVVGGLLTAWVVWEARKSMPVWCALAFGMTYSPLRFFAPQLLIALIFLKEMRE